MQKLGVRIPAPPDDVQRVLDLRRGIARGESATWGSNAERARARHDILGMVRRLGIVYVFMTLSPDTAGTYTVGVNSGQIDSATVSVINAHLLPNRTERRQIAGRNPHACASIMTASRTYLLKTMSAGI